MRRMSLFVLALAPLVASAQNDPDLEKKIDALCAEWKNPDLPGGIIGVAKEGKIVFAKGYGQANLETKTPNTPAIKMDIGSVSKQFTAMCLLLLEEDGKLSLDDEITKYLPEVNTFGHKITIRHILNHTSGLRDYLTLMALQGYNFIDRRTKEDALQTVGQQQGLNFVPGEKYLYSNTGYMLAAEIVERVSGQNLNTFAKERIFAPLGMTDSVFVTDDSQIVAGRALSYGASPAGFVNQSSNLATYGDGAMQSTVADLAKWQANFAANKLGKGGQKLIDRMTEVGVFNDGKKSNYALGVVVDTFHGAKRVHHSGGWMGYNSNIAWYPKNKTGVIVLTNDGRFLATRLCDEVAKLMLGVKAEEQKEVQLTADQLEAVKGQYSLPDGRLLTVSVDGVQAKLQVTGQPAFPMYAQSPTKFFLKAVKVDLEFKMGSDGKATGATLAQGGGTFQLTRGAPFSPSADELKAWVGSYHCAELDMTAEFRVIDGKLQFYSEKAGSSTVTLLSPQGGTFEGGRLKAWPDAQGKVRLITFEGGRAYGMRFIKKADGG